MKNAKVGAVLLGVALAGCAIPSDANRSTGRAEAAAPASGNLFIRNVQLVDLSGRSSALDEPHSILIRNHQIVAVISGSRRAPATDEIDASGLTVLPGLVDMHVHVWDPAVLGAYLSYGITTVRNMSGLPFHLALTEEIEAGRVIAPRLITTGPILNGSGPNAQINHQIVDDPEAARAAVRWQHAVGFRRLKVYSNLSAPAYAAIRDEARALELTITGHSPEGVRTAGVPLERPFEIPFEDILDDGFVTIEHLESVAWHGLRGRLDHEAAEGLASRIAHAGVPITTTLMAHRNLLNVAQHGLAYAHRPGTELLNPFVQAFETESLQHWAGQPTAHLEAEADFFRRLALLFHEAGVVLVAGSDAGIFTNIPGRSLLEELEQLREAGLSNEAVLRAATVTPAQALGEAETRGCLAPGCAADLVVLACDPRQELACLERVEGVVRAGRWVSKAELAELRHLARHQDAAATEARVMSGLEAQAKLTLVP